MKNKKDILILTLSILISIATWPDLIRTVSDELERRELKRRGSKIEYANIFVIDGERLRNPLTRETTINEVTNMIYKGDNLIMSTRLYVQNGCELHKVGNFTFFLDNIGGVKFRLTANLIPFVEGIARVPTACDVGGSEDSAVLTNVELNESYADLKFGYIYYFNKKWPLYSYHVVSYKKT